MFNGRKAILPLLTFCSWAVATTAGDVAPGAVLDNAAAVRSLSAQAAATGRPVRLHGKLLLVTAPRNAIVLIDDTEGIYVELDHVVPDDYRLGDELEITGSSGAGDFAPIVRAQRIDRTGTGTLPPPRRTTIAELDAGGLDAAWVELRGIVRSCKPTPPDQIPVSRGGAVAPDPAAHQSWLVTFAQGDDKMEIQINGPVEPQELVDAEVRLRGVVFNVHNANRQFVRANLQLADASMIDVIVPPARDPFALPVQRLGEVLRFSRSGFSGHRLHVRGVVTGHKDRHTLWLREGDRGMRVASLQEGNLAPGDEVDVLGFPDHGGYAPSLSDAVFRKIASGPAPVPQRLSAPEDISLHDTNLVVIDAKLREIRTSSEELELVLDWEGIEVHARMLQPAANEDVAAWQPGSLVRAAGICVVGQTNFMRPTGLWLAEDLQLWLRDPRDLTVLRAAPWLTTRRALFLMIPLAVVALLALVVVAIVARNQIRQREEARKLAEVEFSAMLAERNRLARDIHDTLAQDLNAVSMQLELAKNSAKFGVLDPVVSYLVTAHQIVRKCLAEARESIWNMRSHILEKNDLPEALRLVAAQLGAGRPCEIRTHVTGHTRRLAPEVENNLLRIGQEAVSNALKHAQPREIEVELGYEERAVRLVVRDDGPGFDPAAEGATSSHFGLRGMRERVAHLNGKFTVGRDARGGTRIEVIVESPDSV